MNESKTKTKDNNKVTRRTLFFSIFACILCIALLVGTTLAWFTDSASNTGNKIQAGKLDVQLVDAEGNNLEGKTLAWQKAAGAEDEEVLWEPGCTYNLEPVYIKNAGNLALKYKIVISGVEGDTGLLKALEFTTNGLDVSTEGHLLAGATSEALTIQAHMDEDAGNEYQGLFINGVSITVVATQDTVEHDSIDNQYDANASYPQEQNLAKLVAKGYTSVASADDLTTAFDNADSTTQKIVLASDITLANAATLNVPAGDTTTLDFNGYTIKATDTDEDVKTEDHQEYTDTRYNAAVTVENGGTLIIDDSTGNGALNYAYTGTNAGWAGKAAILCGGDLVMNGGTVSNNTSTDAGAISLGVDVRPNVWSGGTPPCSASFTMNDGSVTCNGDECVRICNNSSDTYAAGSKVSFTMNGGTLSGWDCVFVQQLNDTFESLYATINDGTLNADNYAVRFFNYSTTWTTTNCVGGMANTIKLAGGNYSSNHGSSGTKSYNGLTDVGVSTPSGTLTNLQAVTSLTDNR